MKYGEEDAEDKDLIDILNLDLEYRLTISYRLASEGGDGCDCVRYLIQRRNVLIPEILNTAKKNNEDPVDVFSTYQRKIHERHQEKRLDVQH